MSLIGVDVGNTTTRMSRFANYLRNLIPSNDVTVMEMAAKAVGILAVSSGAYAAEYVEFEMKRALEWLTGDRNEGRRHAAVSIVQISLVGRKPTFWFPTWSNTNQAVQLQKMARGWKFRIKKVEGLYYLCSENKGADQLRRHREADLRLCFRICKTLVFS